jgi:hypothetical protein
MSQPHHDALVTAPPQSRRLPTSSRHESLAARFRQLIRIDMTPVGRGVFARRSLQAHLVLGEITGTILDDHPEDSSYVMELASGRLLDPAAPLRFVNHSCDPNCEIFYWDEEDGTPPEDRLFLQTIRPIAKGEELSIDYSWPADAAIPCRCGTANCRGWIVDPEERHLLGDPQ